MTNGPWLPDLLGPVVIAAGGVAQTPRPTVNFVGFTGSDNETYDRTDMTPAASGSIGIGQVTVDLTGGDYTLSDEEAAAAIIKVIGTVTGPPTLYFPVSTGDSDVYLRIVRNAADDDILVDVVGDTTPVTIATNGNRNLQSRTIGFDVDGPFEIE